MTSAASIDLLSIDRGAVTAPAGCGKTHLIAESLTRHESSKPVLVLTHTNAGGSLCVKGFIEPVHRLKHTE